MLTAPHNKTKKCKNAEIVLVTTKFFGLTYGTLVCSKYQSLRCGDANVLTSSM